MIPIKWHTEKDKSMEMVQTKGVEWVDVGKG